MSRLLSLRPSANPFTVTGPLRQSRTTASAAMSSTHACGMALAMDSGTVVTPLRSACIRSPGCTVTPPTRTVTLMLGMWQ
jgi:hypothetical protein